MADDCAWLIERGNLPQYIGVMGGGGDGPPVLCEGRFYWTPNPHNALRFSRRCDATLFFGAIRALLDDVPYKLTLCGLRRGDEPPCVREHMWCELPADAP